MFDSRDAANRICAHCARTNSREYLPRVTGSRVYGDGGSTTIDSDEK